MEGEAVRKEKARLRAHLRATREALSDADYAARSALIRARLMHLPEVEAARTVHVYWPLVARREVDTRPLIAALHGRGVRVALPVMEEPGVGSAPRLTQRLYTGPDRLVERRWGLVEPTGGEGIAPEALDLVIVPAIGAGRNGHRLGYGAGYYDAFLTETSARAVCPVFAACLLPDLPAEPHDHALSVLVTEDEVLRLTNAR